jgi:hypothetical protein
MKSKLLFAAIGNIDDRFIAEDAEVITILKESKIKRTVTFSPWLKLAAPLAACLIIAVAIWGLPNLFTNPNDPSVVIPPSNTSVEPSVPPALETPKQIGFYGEYSTLAELIALSEQSGQDIEKKISEIRESYIDHPSGCFINLETKADLELISQLFRKPLFPVVNDTLPSFIELYYVFDSYDNPSRPDHWQVSLRYEMDGTEYNFTVSENESEKIISEFAGNIYWELEPIKDEGDIRIFLKSPQHPDVVVPETVIHFGLDVRGLWVDATVYDAGDIQVAVDSLLSFDFKTLSY